MEQRQNTLGLHRLRNIVPLCLQMQGRPSASIRFLSSTELFGSPKDREHEVRTMVVIAQRGRDDGRHSTKMTVQ